MAKCAWCDESAPGADFPSCTECLFKATPVRKVREAKKVPSGLSLEYYDDTVGSDRPANGPLVVLGDVRRSDLRAGMNHDKSLPQIQESKMKVKSNSIRSRALVEDGDLILNFNESGVAEVPDHERSRVERLMNVRPGRFTIMGETHEVEVSVPRTVMVSADVDVVRAAVEAEDAPEKSDEAEGEDESVTPSVDSDTKTKRPQMKKKSSKK